MEGKEDEVATLRRPSLPSFLPSLPSKFPSLPYIPFLSFPHILFLFLISPFVIRPSLPIFTLFLPIPASLPPPIPSPAPV